MKLTKENLSKVLGLRPNGYTMGKKRTTLENDYTRQKNGFRIHVDFKDRKKIVTIMGRGGPATEFFDLLEIAYKSGRAAGRDQLKEEFQDLMQI